MQSGKGRQPGKATTGICNPPPSHLCGSGCAAPHFKLNSIFFLVSSFGIYTRVFEIRQQKLSGVVSVENVPVSKLHLTDFSLWIPNRVGLVHKAKKGFSLTALPESNFKEYFNHYVNSVNSAWKEPKPAREGSHLSVPRVLEDGVPGVAFCLGHVAVIFVAIAPPLPEERSGKQKKNTLAVYWSTTHFGLYFYVKARKFGNLARIVFKPLVWCELMSPL